jgi:Tfp pilus assembly protein PilN
MEKTLDLKLTSAEASRIEAAIAKCDGALRQIFRRMKKDQAEIDKLKAQTRARLAEMKRI